MITQKTWKRIDKFLERSPNLRFYVSYSRKVWQVTFTTERGKMLGRSSGEVVDKVARDALAQVKDYWPVCKGLPFAKKEK